MDWNQLDIDFDRLSEETLWLVDQIGEGKSVKELEAQFFEKKVVVQNIQETQDFIPAPAYEKVIILEETAAQIPFEAELITGPIVEGSGVIFYVDIQGGTFSIRGMPTNDLKKDYARALAADPVVLEQMRIQDVSSCAHIQVFHTPGPATAEMLADQIFNRRFPRQEDSYLNVSDPGPGLWFIDRGPNEFCLSFKRVFRQGLNTLSLGPLIDPRVALRRFNDLATGLVNFPAVLSLQADEKAVLLKSESEEGQKLILNFRELFLDGRLNFQKEDFQDNAEGRTLFYFFLELAFIRSFWLETERILQA